MPRERGKIFLQQSSWLRTKDEKGKVWTVENFAILFTLRQYEIYDIDSEQTKQTNTKLLFEPSGFVSARYPTHEEIAKRLSSWVQPILQKGTKYPYPKTVKITASQVEKEILDCLKVGRYLRQGKNLVRIYWVINTFLKRLPIGEASKWITLAGGAKDGWFKDFMATSAEQEMQKHMREVLKPEMQVMKKEIEESLLEKLKKKLKG